jgi:FkbM family methyltransferase
MEAVNPVLDGGSALAPRRNGHISEVGGFSIFVDEDSYAPDIRALIDAGHYEGRERRLVSNFIAPGDRVIEVGTAIGAVAMTAASIVGAKALMTFDANPDIVSDARENFRRNGLSEIASRCGLLKNRANFAPGSVADFYVHKDFWASRLDAGPDAPNIVKIIQIPVFCLEDEIRAHGANIIISDIEGGEVDLLMEADLSGIRVIIMETHYWSAGEPATDAMIRKLIIDGFALHLGESGGHVSVFRR